MTKEEAKTFLCSIAGDLGFTDIENYTCKDGEKMREAIEALEQEPILDKIREEIMDFEKELFHRLNTYYTDYATVRHCVEIIDKYKAENY